MLIVNLSKKDMQILEQKANNPNFYCKFFSFFYNSLLLIAIDLKNSFNLFSQKQIKCMKLICLF